MKILSEQTFTTNIHKVICDSVQGAIDEIVEKIVEEACNKVSKEVRDHAAKVALKADAYVDMSRHEDRIQITIRLPGWERTHDSHKCLEQLESVNTEAGKVEVEEPKKEKPKEEGYGETPLTGSVGDFS